MSGTVTKGVAKGGKRRVLILEATPVPLATDKSGVVRVGGTRVTLDSVIYAFDEGSAAEEIALRYPTLRLVDIYAVITYYLLHREEVREYLRQEEQRDEQARRENEARHNLVGIRERLLARRAGKDN
jgi:uncharacterized protein (DUF433 family)